MVITGTQFGNVAVNVQASDAACTSGEEKGLAGLALTGPGIYLIRVYARGRVAAASLDVVAQVSRRTPDPELPAPPAPEAVRKPPTSTRAFGGALGSGHSRASAARASAGS